MNGMTHELRALRDLEAARIAEPDMPHERLCDLLDEVTLARRFDAEHSTWTDVPVDVRAEAAARLRAAAEVCIPTGSYAAQNEESRQAWRRAAEAVLAVAAAGNPGEAATKPELLDWSTCKACGKPMNLTHAGFWIGPDAPRHGNCANYAEPAPEVTPRSVNPPEPTAEEFQAAYERGEGVPVMDEAPPVVAAGPGREAEGLEPTAGLEPAASGSVPGALRSGSRTPGSDRPADGSSELRRPAQSTAPADPVEPPEPPPSWPPVVDEDALYVARQYFDRSGLVWNDDRARLYINAYLAAADAGDRARALVGQTTEEGRDD